MPNKKNLILPLIKEILNITITCILGIIGIVFSVLYLDTFNGGFILKYYSVILSVSVSLISSLTVLTILFYKIKKDFIYKLCYLTIILIAFCLVFLYVLKATGFLDKIDSIEDFRDYISSFGANAVILFILVQFLQVVVLPIPGFITVGAGVLLFGPLMGAIYSFIGIIIGSFVGFLIGRVFGYKVASWLVGKDNLDKALKSVKGKDRVVLTFMFLFPFFPDDVLCFVAGLSTMSWGYFSVMITITRLISVFSSSYSMNNSLIPYNTWWGLVIWAVIIGITIFFTIVIYKKGDKIEHWFLSKFKKRKKKVSE